MQAAIEVDGLGKLFHIGDQPFGRRALWHLLPQWVGNRARQKQASTELWALRDVSFAVQRGEAVGIIGRNGAGKSTLLKILSRITEPSEGRVKIRGRVRSLLEVGTGFHPELTGRDNVFLNGVLLGMGRAEVARKLDEIVAFSGVHEFLDTPVKRYSSGMRVRLAFAVAAHLDPDIFVVDEVLAVGDAEFQRRCLGKMHDVASSGRTVLFVSHNMGSVLELTERCLLLDDGRLVVDGPSTEVVQQYVGDSQSSYSRDLSDQPRASWIQRLDRFQFTHVEVVAPDGELRAGSPLEIRLTYRAHQAVQGVDLGVCIAHPNGTRLVTCRSGDSGFFVDADAGTSGTVVVEIGEPRLAPGRYVLELGSNSGGANELDSLTHALHFDVAADARDGFAVTRLGRKNLGLRLASVWSRLR